MPFELMKSVENLMEQVREKTGKGFETAEISGLPVSARIEPAGPGGPDGKGAPVHRLLIRPGAAVAANYIIANQCCHMLRLYSAPAEKRMIPVANRRTMMSYIMETEDDIHRIGESMGKDKVKKLVTMWYEGVVYQLTKMPPDIMIDKWLYDKCPEIRPVQLNSIRRQRDTAILSISEDLKRITPLKIYNSSNIMNYTFFKTLEDHFHLDFVAPYHNTPFIFEGGPLAKITEQQYVDSHEGDNQMINIWAERLNLTKWFEWKHFES
ncbi:MAG: hypothetical protein ABFD62_08520 [Syntrophaceae bacterium]